MDFNRAIHHLEQPGNLFTLLIRVFSGNKAEKGTGQQTEMFKWSVHTSLTKDILNF